MVASAACGAKPVLVSAGPPPDPYDGPLWVDERVPGSTDPSRRIGAASRVVECDGTPTDYLNSEPDTILGVSRTPSRALARAMKKGAHFGLTSGFRLEREERDRVLFTVDVASRTKEAVIMHDGPSQHFGTGWYLESWARCDLAELPPAVADEAGVQVWTDAAGRRMDTSRVKSYAGARHCNWEHMTILVLNDRNPERPPARVYVANAGPDLQEYVAEPYDADVALPATAIDTGYHRAGRHLWLAADRRRAYVGTPDRVELWPLASPDLRCA